MNAEIIDFSTSTATLASNDNPPVSDQTQPQSVDLTTMVEISNLIARFETLDTLLVSAYSELECLNDVNIS